MSLFRKKAREEVKEEPRDDYIEFGAMVLLSGDDGISSSKFNKVYNVTFEEMLARLGKVTYDKEKGSAFIAQQFTPLKDYNDMIDSNRRNKHVDKQD